ncbi:MAG: undecaprenyldiphospho-muramoylpentapeptide beta-N-acetylglucosaminyltransferase [Treponema sp.]|nr:undecaprenyldiphospho-muramoylpentapeptide beta-N-acetylglucosaminyltransferase [Treponema sp.]
MKLNRNVVAFTGGGTAGHIYPGLAVADELKDIAGKKSELRIIWIGCSKGMDKKIVENAFGPAGKKTAACFYGIPSGKLRRYFSWQNFSDMFRIIAGYFKAKKILRKEKPCMLFSKGGFVSVPPCLAAKHLGIPVFTHECDFTLGLANRLNFKSADKMFVSYEETKKRLSQKEQKKVIVTGNPVRPVFYDTKPERGLKFLGIDENHKKPVLLILGGSSGARQINQLVTENLEWLCKNFIVVHQSGLLNNDDNLEKQLHKKYKENYKAYQFIYEQMPDVVSCADVILSRAGANSIWEAAVLYKPMVLIPLCGSGTRGDQVDNARFFEEKKAALVLVGDDACSQKLIDSLSVMLTKKSRDSFSKNIKEMVGERNSAKIIAGELYDVINN